jgi:general secretion pathway protein D
MLVAGIHSSSAEALITAQDYAVDSDVVLESALREIKSAPRDTVNVIGDSLKYASDETVTAAKGVAAVFKGSPHEKAQRAGELAVEDAWLTSDEILFRSYKVSDDVGHDLMQGADVPEGEAADVSAFFTGMNLPKGASVIYRPEFNKLFVRQTMENMLLIEDTLADSHNASRELLGHQIEIETKFVEVSQSTLNELGFNWSFDGKGPNGVGSANIFENLTLPPQDLLALGLRSATGALGANATAGSLLAQKTAGSLRWSLIINALEQAEDSDVLSAPSIVTRDGNTATIMVGEDRMVPKRFGTSTRNSAVYVEHSDWEQQLMGVTLQVRPELRAEGLIDLDLKPKVIDLIGYDNYQISPADGLNPDGSPRPAAMWPIQNNRLDISGKQGRYPIVSNAGRALGGVYDGIVKTLDDTWGNGGDPNMITNYVGQLGTANQSYQVGSGYFDTFRELDKDEMIQIPALNGQLPYFRLREMQTRVTVEDGSTVGMGGLIYDKLETYRDKVPVLGSIPLIGRLFRSEGEKSIKRNLMIFVTATQVDINGRKASDLALNQ